MEVLKNIFVLINYFKIIFLKNYVQILILIYSFLNSEITKTLVYPRHFKNIKLPSVVSKHDELSIKEINNI